MGTYPGQRHRFRYMPPEGFPCLVPTLGRDVVLLDGQPAGGGEMEALTLPVMDREDVAIEGVSAPFAGVWDRPAVRECHHEISHARSLA